MGEPTDYHRKLAPILLDACMSPEKRDAAGGDVLRAIAAVLASEQVVDPEEFMQAQRHISRCHEQINERDAEVERLKAGIMSVCEGPTISDLQAEIERLKAEIIDGIELEKRLLRNEGMERAAKIVDAHSKLEPQTHGAHMEQVDWALNCRTLAAAIRAEVKK